MSAGFPPGFGAPPGAPPGFAPAAPPGYQQQPQAQDFVLDIAPDPTWQPMDSSDTLDQDGFYQCRIKSEKVRNDDGKLQIIFTLEIQDQDARGKTIARFMQDPRQTKGDTWWQWRGLMRSITGSVQGGQQGLQYRPGVFTNQICYVKTGAYNDNKGNMRTGVEAWSTKDEWEEAYKRGGHRWAAKVHVSQAPGVGALPGGSGGLPGAPAAGGMPPLPGAPLAPGVPAPGAAPMQSAPTNPFAAPPPAAASAPPAPQQNPFGAPPAPSVAPPPAQAAPGFGFGPPAGAPPPAAAAPPAPIPFPPPANGVPQPTAAGVAMSFPGTQPPPR